MREDVAALVALSAAVAAPDREGLRTALRRAAEAAGATAIEEALLQSYLFLGFPAALRALGEWRRVSGIAAPDVPSDDVTEWMARGAATCRRIYGEQYDRLRRNVAALHPDVERWMIMEGYGKVLSRPGLDLAARELCIVALLAGQDAAPQLYSHLRGALNAGASEDEVEGTIALLSAQLTDDAAGRLREQWDAVRARRMNDPGD
jgi:4-carboxymuconolactone decarboxylase